VIQIFTRRNAEQGLQPRLKLGFGSHQTGSAASACPAAINTRFNLAPA
jgi:vitamin B12 transporter